MLADLMIFLLLFSVVSSCRETEEVSSRYRRNGPPFWRPVWCVLYPTMSFTSTCCGVCFFWRAPALRTLYSMAYLVWNGKISFRLSFLHNCQFIFLQYCFDLIVGVNYISYLSWWKSLLLVLLLRRTASLLNDPDSCLWKVKVLCCRAFRVACKWRLSR